MEIFKDNIGKIEEELRKGLGEINRLHTSAKILNLYNSMEVLKDFCGVDLYYAKGSILKSAISNKNKYERENLRNFRNSFFELYDFFLGLKERLGREELLQTEHNESIKLDDSDMFSLIREYYMTLRSDCMYSLFIGLDKELCISDVDSNVSRNVYSRLIDNNYIFVRNRENMITVSDIVFNLKQLSNKMNLSVYGPKYENLHLYLDNFKYTFPLVDKKNFLNWVKSKYTIYKNEVNNIFTDDYKYLLECLDLLPDIMRQGDLSFSKNKTLENINYIYGQFLSDVYLYLDDERREIFLNYMKSRRNKLFGKDILEVLGELTGLRDYGLSIITEEQYKKYTKK